MIYALYDKDGKDLSKNIFVQIVLLVSSKENVSKFSMYEILIDSHLIFGTAAVFYKKK